MDGVLEKIILTIVGILVTTLVGWLTAQIVRYKKLIKQEEDNTVKTTIVNTLNDGLKPVKEDISNMKKDIAKLQNVELTFTTNLQPIQAEIDHLKDDITVILDDIKQKGIDLQRLGGKQEHLEKETRCAWRYRIRQLCHAYLARGWISYGEYEQLQEMFNLYTAIGGNGQTKELYDKTINLEMKSDAEAAAILAEERSKTCPNGGCSNK